MNNLMIELLLILYGCSIVGVLLIIVSENRNPLKSLPWVVVLLFAPVVGLILYFFFGHNLSKRRALSRRMRKQVNASADEAATTSHPAVEESLRPLQRLLLGSGYALPLHHTDIEVYTSGAPKLEALCQALESARHHIHIQYYIFEADRIGHRVREILMRKAREGVEVRLLYDNVGSRNAHRLFFDEMTEAGVEVSEFLHVNFPRFASKVNYRNHRKVVVVDGRIGFVGGMNIADRYLYGSKLGPWRDTHFRLTGGGVKGLQQLFLNDWQASTRIALPTDERYFPHLEGNADNTLQLLAAGPLGKWRTLLQAYCQAIGRANHRIWIQTPYYLPTESLNNALQTAALAGVDVRLMLPERSDSRLVDLAAHSYLDDMLRAGVKVEFYMAGFLHSKLMIIDDSLTIFGSANLDFRSFEHNFEVSGFLYDAPFNARMAAIYEADRAQCRQITPADWFNRSRMSRLAESVMRLFSPLL